MPNAKRSGASRRKKATGTKASGSGTNSTGFGGPEFSFSFSSPSSSTFPPSSPGPSTNGKGGSKGARYAVPSSSEEDQSSEDEDDTSESDGAPEADEDLPPPEKPDSELTDAEKLERAEVRKEAGNVLFKKKDYPSATRLYSQAISLAPENAAYKTNRAASYMASKLYRQALDDCLAASVLQKAAPQPKTLLRLARCQLALGLVVAAQQTLDQLFAIDPANADVNRERMRSSRIANHVANVQRERANKAWGMVLFGIDAAVKEVEETPREWKVWKIEALVGKKQYDQASGMAADLLRGDASQPEPLYYRGLCLYYSGNHPQAIAHCTQALRNDPDFVLARTLLRKVKLFDSLKDAGNDAFKGNRLQEAIDKYTEALGVDEEHDTMRATLLSNRATAYLKLKDTTSAMSDVEICLELQPSYFKALRTRARIHLALENYEAAVRDFKAAYEAAPAGSNDETALKKEVADAEAKLKRSKMKDHYKTLGTHSEATEDEIKKAYRKSSLLHHPDKGGSEEKFKEVGEAYAILSDPARRRKFDAGIDENDPHSGHGDDFGMGGFGGGGMNFEDMFGGGASFGGGYGGGYGGGGGYGRRANNPYGF